MKIIGIGRNYINHARELNNSLPRTPVFFIKPENTVIRKNQPFFYPDFSNDIHYEVEIVLKINRLGRHISPSFAHRYFAEIGLGIDFTARDIQRECKDNGLPWEPAKAFDNSAAISPAFLSVDQFENVKDIDFRLDINNTTVQTGNTGNMIFSYEKIIEHVSRFVTLKNGDIIMTGTPEGVGPVNIEDQLTGYIANTKMLELKVK